MSEKCRCCGQPLPMPFSSAQLRAAMQRPGPKSNGRDGRRNLYRCADTGRWHLTFGSHSGEPTYFLDATVKHLIETGAVRAPKGYTGTDYLELV